jgi:uncharacterized surface protein with fasciclin (FAS1) repeats
LNALCFTSKTIYIAFKSYFHVKEAIFVNTNWRKYTILLAILALMVGIASTSFAQDGGMGELENPTHITFLNNIEGAPPVDVYVGEVGGGHVVEDVAAGAESAQVDLEAGTYTVSVVPAGALSPIVLTTEVELEANTVYQLSINGTLDALADVASELTTVEGMDDTATDDGDMATDDTDAATDDTDATTDDTDAATDDTDAATDDTDATTDDTDAATDDTDAATDDTDATTDDGDMAAAETVADIITGRDELSNVGFAIGAVRLAETLGGEGPYTVFAPNDDVLDNLALLTLLRNRGTASVVLLNHVVEGNLTAEDLVGMDGETLTTLAGNELAVAVDGDTVTVGGVSVVEADLVGSNGVVHIIDGILAPAAEEDMDAATDDTDAATDDGDADAADESAEMGTVVDAIVGNENLSTITGIMMRDDLPLPVLDALATPGPFTIFAPNDDAFAAVDELFSSLGIESVFGILTTHVVVDSLTLDDLVALAGSDTPELSTFANITLTVSLDDDGNVVLTPEGGQPGVLTGEVLEASNGNVFVLSTVILPPPPPGTGGAPEGE